jgi:hypothetical protein
MIIMNKVIIIAMMKIAMMMIAMMIMIVTVINSMRTIVSILQLEMYHILVASTSEMNSKQRLNSP